MCARHGQAATCRRLGRGRGSAKCLHWHTSPGSTDHAEQRGRRHVSPKQTRTFQSSGGAAAARSAPRQRRPSAAAHTRSSTRQRNCRTCPACRPPGAAPPARPRRPASTPRAAGRARRAAARHTPAAACLRARASCQLRCTLCTPLLPKRTGQRRSCSVDTSPTAAEVMTKHHAPSRPVTT
jgi:hypothetical protein